MARQSEWIYRGNLGDASPVDHGGYFLYQDLTGVYGFEAERLEPVSDEADPNPKWVVHRVCLNQCKLVDGVLVSANYDSSWPHPLHSYEEWFARDLDKIAETTGTTETELVGALCSDEGPRRAWAYQCIEDYHGWGNLDPEPRFLTRSEVEARYTRGELA
jgi:hypothetical protein